MKKRVFIIIALLTIVFTQSTYAQVSFTASAKNVVSTNEQFRLTFTVNAKGSGFRAPDLRNFHILAGPSTSTNSSVQIINGKVTQNMQISYTYILQAKKTGKFTIGAAQITVNGKKHQTHPITIEVIKGSAPNQNNTNQSQANVGNNDLFIRINLNKTSVYQGEHIIATVKIYSSITLEDFKDMKFPTYKGFWSQDIETPNRIALKRENVNGKIYETGVLKKTILYPQLSGELIIDPVEIECIVRVPTGRRSFWGEITRREVKKIRSPVRKIRVKPLPPNKPESFTGAVGSYSMETSVDKQKATTNDAITLKVTITGNGNLKLIDPLDIKFPPDFEIYDPKVNANIHNTSAGASGNKTFEYLMIPRHAGSFTIDPVKFSYFDVKSGQYKTLQSEEYAIEVEKGSGDNEATVISGARKEDIKFIGSDIRYIMTDNINLHRKGKTLFGSLPFYLTYTGSLLAFVVVFILRRKHIKEAANIQLMKTRKARKISRKRLKTAHNFMKQNNKEQFYTEVSKALWGYVSDKLNIPFSELSQENAGETLKRHQVEENTIKRFLNILNNCEYARFAPATEETKMENIYQEASEIIHKLENELR